MAEKFQRKNLSKDIYPKYLFDEEGHRHQIKEKIGQGGQGAVFLTNDKNVVIKVEINEIGEIVKDEDSYDLFKSDIDEIRILDLPNDIHIARPVLMLKRPYNGYIMRLLSGMEPIKKLMLPPVKEEMGLAEYYLKTGGLRRRLIILSKAARMLARLHSLPVVYADISPDNIFVSSNVEASEVWLIDADNMRYTIDFSNSIYTPYYAAPEIVKGVRGNNTLSDCYSFALLAFELLALLSPFDGEYIEDGGGSWDDDEDTDSGEDLFEKAQRGELPWVEDEDDDSNYSAKGIPRDIILSKKMRDLFQQTFGLEGKKNPAARPIMKNWYKVLQQAADATIECKHCGSTFFANSNTCPFCNKKRSSVYYAIIADYYNTEDLPEKSRVKKLAFKFFDIKDTQYLYNIHTADPIFEEGIKKTIEISFDKYIKFKNLSHKILTIELPEKKRDLGKGDSEEIRKEDFLTLYIPVNKHKFRVIYFKKV